MRRSGSAWALVALALAGCSVSTGDNSGFDGSIFDQPDAASGDAAASGEDSGRSSTDDAGSDGADAGSLDAGALGSAKPEQVPGILAEATCAALSDCMGASSVLDYLNVSDCVAFYTKQQADRDLHWLADSVKAGRVRWHAEGLAQCQADLRAVGCEIKSRRLPASCAQAVEGTVAVGDKCEIDFDCQGNSYCKRAANSGCGVCSARNAAAVACTASSDCVDGLVCSSSSKTCVMPPMEGDACAATGSWCAPGLVCLGASSSATCRNMASVLTGAVGNACDIYTALCEPGLACESTGQGGSAGLCAQKVGANGSCKGAVPSECPMGQHCDAVQAGSTGKCVALPGEGDACLKNTCTVDYACTVEDGLCHALTPGGGSCIGDRQCYSNECLAQSCVLPLQCTQ